MAKKDDDKELTLEERQMAFQEAQLAIQQRQLEIQEAGIRVQRAQLEQTKPKSLQQPPNISPFNLRGQKDFPMPRLKCEIYAPWKIDPNLQDSSPQLDREEVELFNLLEPGTYQIERIDGETVTCNVVGVRNQITGVLEKLSLMGQKDPDTNQYASLFNKENKQTFPSLKIMLRQCLEQQGTDFSGVKTMRAEAKLIAEGAEAEKAGFENPYPVSVGA